MHSLTMNTTPYSKARRLFTRTQEEIKLCEDKNCLIFRLMNRRGELKDLLPILEYAFLEDDNKFTVISAKELSLGEKSRSVQVRIYEKEEHFMVKEGICPRHKISKNGIEVDKAKIDVMPIYLIPTTVKGVVISLPKDAKASIAPMGSPPPMEFDYKFLTPKGSENLAADHLSD
ncbi:hypothetical protein Tco_0412229 [Tanacetum coccineum]